MPTPHDLEIALRSTHDRRSFLQKLLVDGLEWRIPEHVEDPEDIAYAWSAADLRATGLDRHLIEGQVWQIPSLQKDQPWGIFLLEFTNADAFISSRGLTGPLRKVLRGLVPSRRQHSNLATWQREHLLFICTHGYEHFRFAYFKAPPDRTHAAPLAAFGWGPDMPARTACEFNLPALVWPASGASATDWVNEWASAFDVEKVTRRFYEDYAQVFQALEQAIRAQLELRTAEDLRMFTQTLVNRLMFLRFLERKGWLKFNGRDDYLRTLYQAGPHGRLPFYLGRLCPLFFQGLATQERKDCEAYGQVPFLNGGLFEKNELDGRVSEVPYAALGPLIGSNGLFYRYNFTVEESTPLDIDVAVDPEMLGKVFEELVTGRHESGSYYTPRPIVSFMCREALKGYLTAKTKARPEAIAALVDQATVAGLTEQHGRQILDALDSLKAVDPACGSGAYLLGLLHELVAIYRLLMSEKLVKDCRSLYDLKLRIISHNLYGVDIDPFATNIAMLRLWLSLEVEADDPVPLPNLDFKIETGDSLLGPDPGAIPDLYSMHLRTLAGELLLFKEQYLTAHGAERERYRKAVAGLEADIEKELHTTHGERVIDWRVHFAEVFVNNGGFDIALENPPYVRMELFKAAKPALRANFPKVFVSGADLYVYFFARTCEVLRPGGIACVISSNKWLKAGYGESLRRFFAESTWVSAIVDFGHAKQIFQEADVFPSILIFRRPTESAPPPTAHTCAIPRERLRLDDLTRQVQSEGFAVPRKALGAAAWLLEAPGVGALLEKIRRIGVPLKEYAGAVPLMGIKTGFNDAFLLDTPTKNRLVAADRKSAKLFRPYLRGQDIDRWAAEWSGLWMLALKSSGNHPWPWADAGRKAESIFAATYPAIHAHLSQHRAALVKRQDQGEYWWELRACAYWDQFDRPKVMYQDITWGPCFCQDTSGTLSNNTVYFLPTANRWVLAALNSPVSWSFAWRGAQHCKDEGLRFFTAFMETFPVPAPTDEQHSEADSAVQDLIDVTGQMYDLRRQLTNRLTAEFDLEKLSQKLQDPVNLDEEALVREVQKARGRRTLTAAKHDELRDMHAYSVTPLQALAAEARELERRVADLVNAAYGLTPEEVALMWQTAPPRMPGAPPAL